MSFPHIENSITLERASTNDRTTAQMSIMKHKLMQRQKFQSSNLSIFKYIKYESR